MPTPSEPLPAPPDPPGRWAATPSRPPRSVFDNFRPQRPPRQHGQRELPTPTHLAPADPRFEAALAENTSKPAHGSPGSPPAEPRLCASAATALARSYLYHVLARAYDDPLLSGWPILGSAENRATLLIAVKTLGEPSGALAEAVDSFLAQLGPEHLEAFQGAYLAAFGHAARGQCPLNEIEYGDLKADPLYQPHRLADLAAFYRAFGLDLAADATERLDHLGIELEFMSVLAAKEAYAVERQLGEEPLAVCRDAQRLFLREHLGRWVPAFGRRLAALVPGTPLAALAELTKSFVEAECRRSNVSPGAEELLLRPVDETAESLCAACVVGSLPPGAMSAGEPEPAGAGS